MPRESLLEAPVPVPGVVGGLVLSFVGGAFALIAGTIAEEINMHDPSFCRYDNRSACMAAALTVNVGGMMGIAEDFFSHRKTLTLAWVGNAVALSVFVLSASSLFAVFAGFHNEKKFHSKLKQTYPGGDLPDYTLSFTNITQCTDQFTLNPQEFALITASIAGPELLLLLSMIAYVFINNNRRTGENLASRVVKGTGSALLSSLGIELPSSKPKEKGSDRSRQDEGSSSSTLLLAGNVGAQVVEDEKEEEEELTQ